MRRGTTPIFKLTLKNKSGRIIKIDGLEGGLSDGRVTFEQRDKIIVDKKLSECEFSNGSILVTLTQEETLKFDASSNVNVQCKFKDSSGVVVATKTKQFPCRDILNEEVL